MDKVQKQLKEIDLESLHKYIVDTIPEHFVNNPGVEPYAYYAYLSTTLPKGSLIADLGSLQGLSALALGYNKNVEVISYDIDQSKNIVQNKDNVTFVLGNVLDQEHLIDILEANLILVDIDPHDGIQEQEFLDLLLSNDYKGITVWDDIHHNLGMKNFWHKVKLPKEDVTQYGHHSGTGIIYFNQGERYLKVNPFAIDEVLSEDLRKVYEQSNNNN